MSFSQFFMVTKMVTKFLRDIIRPDNQDCLEDTPPPVFRARRFFSLRVFCICRAVTFAVCGCCEFVCFQERKRADIYNAA